MDTARPLTILVAICFGLFVMGAVGGSIYGIFVWYPEQRRRRIEELKAAGRKGEAMITRLDERMLRNSSMRRALFRIIPVGLEVRVPGIEPYQVDKVFTLPASVVEHLATGKIVSVWVDPKEPRNIDKIVIDLN